MANDQDPDDSAEDAVEPATEPDDGEPDAVDDKPAAPPALAAAPATEPGQAASAPAGSAQPGNLATLSAQLREAAAEIAEIAAQAGRLGIAIDAAKALREGTTPEALRRLVLERASAAADARDIVAAAPAPLRPQAKESPIVAAAKRAAASGKRG